ncbi:hypothetical protein H0H93_015973 [Arthromyces matolae]|nr:hypothetical protein H0H93_015973 [Arthromyces matolae]
MGKNRTTESFPPVTWSSDLTWNLINEVEKTENRKVIIGKLKNENSSRDHKIQVYKRIAEKILPVMFAGDAGTAANRVKSKWEALRKTYAERAKRLRATGEGVQNSDNDSEETITCCIPPEGPDASTPDQAKNIWTEIINNFEYFPKLHELLATRSNVTPIAITTGTGPSGQKTVYFQIANAQPGPGPAEVLDANIDPILLALSSSEPANPAPAPASLSPATPTPITQRKSTSLEDIDKENVSPSISLPVATPARGPKSSMFDAAVAKANTSIKRIPQKPSIEATFVSMQKRTLKLSQARFQEESEQKRRKLDLAERELNFQEFKAGLITKEEFLIAKEAANKKSKREIIILDSSSDVEIDDDIKPVLSF